MHTRSFLFLLGLGFGLGVKEVEILTTGYRTWSKSYPLSEPRYPHQSWRELDRMLSKVPLGSVILQFLASPQLKLDMSLTPSWWVPGDPVSPPQRRSLLLSSQGAARGNRFRDFQPRGPAASSARSSRSLLTPGSPGTHESK